MVISDPQLRMDMSLFGQEVKFSTKYQSLDGFIKQNETCIIVLPSVHKVASSPAHQPNSHKLGELVVKAIVLPIEYDFPPCSDDEYE